MIDMKDKFMCISIRQDGYEMFSNGGWASYDKGGKITGSCGDVDSFPAILNVSVAGKKEFDTDKTLEQRVADLEKQLADTLQAANDKMETIKTHLDNVWMMLSKSPTPLDAGITLSVGFRKDNFKFSDNK